MTNDRTRDLEKEVVRLLDAPSPPPRLCRWCGEEINEGFFRSVISCCWSPAHIHEPRTSTTWKRQ